MEDDDDDAEKDGRHLTLQKKDLNVQSMAKWII